MRSNQATTLFVSLLLAPNQSSLFQEIGQEAICILDGCSDMNDGVELDSKEILLLDRDSIRLSLSMSSLMAGDALVLAVGTAPDSVLSRDEALKAADILRQLVKLSETLFEVSESIWQASIRPLDLPTLDAHAEQLEITSPDTTYRAGEAFITIEPDRMTTQDSPVGETEEDQAVAIGDANIEATWPMQAATLALSTAFVLVTPPVGIAMFTYAALRQGADMDLLPGGKEKDTADYPEMLRA